MTVQEALDQRIPRVRLAVWQNPNAYLRLPLMANGLHGPWAELYDDDTQQYVLKVRPGSQKIPTWTPSESTFEAYTGAVSPFEQHPENFAGAYVES